MTSYIDVRAYIAREILKDNEVEITPDRHLIRDGLLTSIGLMKLIEFLSDKYSIQFEDDDYNVENFETLHAIQMLLERRVESQKTAA
jgi:acyl carrier protein